MKKENIEKLSLATLRSLVIDGTNKAKSGHPGMALGSAPLLYVLYTKHMVADPNNPKWINRDRFVLSSGHASMLLYSTLHLAGYDISLEDLKQFRQLDSLTPGHPEYLHTPGVDATSGPLGQGVAQAVGLAMAERTLSSMYGSELISHYTYCLCGDGDLQEGISQEAIDFAGLQRLNKLIVIFDSNKITLDGPASLSTITNTKARFEASGWNVLEIKDGNNLEEIDSILSLSKKCKDKPTLVIMNTVIGYGSAKQGTNAVHGNPLGLEDGKRTKVDVYGFDHDDFYVSDDVYEHFKETFFERGNKKFISWNKHLIDLEKDNKVLYNRFVSLSELDVSKYLPEVIPNLPNDLNEATRKTSHKALNSLALSIPNLFGGSADVAGSVLTSLNGGTDCYFDNPSGHNINFGIREFFMAACQNGMLLHGGLRTYVGCFLVFSDYLKPAIRLAALSKLPAIYIFSHDTIALGEDGPTHQPIEQLAMLRSIPNVTVYRPADAKETYASWILALRKTDGPSVIITSRQNLPLLKNTSFEGVSRGGYFVSKAKKEVPDLQLIATGSEVSLAIQVQDLLVEKGIEVDVVSLTSMSLFDQQDDSYIDSVLRTCKCKRVSIEMLTTFGWGKYAKYNIGIDSFGASAPSSQVMKKFGFVKEDIAKYCESILK